jgi:8-oxo-dGTP pyrophosphatase MutT (NUDIX family)
MITLEKTDDFKNVLQVVGCFLEHEGKILFLKRTTSKPESGAWGAPGGKVDPHEEGNTVKAIVREVFEETGIVIDAKKLQEIGVFYVIHPNEKYFVYTKYRYILDDLPEVVLQESEHTDLTWVTPTESLELSLVLHEDFTIKHAYGIE